MTIIFRPRRSFLLLSLFILLHGLATLCLILTAAKHLWLYLLLPPIFISAIYHYHYACLHLPRSVAQLGRLPSKWFIATRRSGIVEVFVLPESIVTRYVMLIYFKAKCDAQYFTLLLFPDSLPTNQLRQLRIQLALHYHR